MIISASTSFVSAFLASFVEAVEALTIVLAAGSIRGWRPALIGAGSALLLLTVATALAGPFLQLLPIQIVRLALGLFLLIFGLRWLRKAILRAAGVIPQRDEAKVYARTEDRLRSHELNIKRFDSECFVTSFTAVFIEGLEVVFIVLSLGAVGNALLFASLGAASACISVVGLGWLLHHPLTKIPENWFKFTVGILLTADGLGTPWPGGDMALMGLFIATLCLSLLAVLIIRQYQKLR